MDERIPAIQREPVQRRRGGKLLWIVIVLFVIVLVVLFFRSSLSKVTVIEVHGNAHLTAAEVQGALSVKIGDSFFSPGTAVLEKRVKKLQAVHTVVVSKSFPGHVAVTLKEYPEVAVELDEQGKLSIVLSNGLSIASQAGASLPNKPVLSYWKADDPQRTALCQTLGDIQGALIDDLSEIVPDPSPAYPDRIKLYTRSGFEVLTTVGKLRDKVSILNELVENREPGKVIMLDSDSYRPYSAQSASE